jgi:hypothetical protein
MAFIKLDTGIIRSTIWFDRPALEVFITALLLAEPAEYDVPIPQLRVGALEPTGWSAPPGWYGFVPASGPGLVAAAQVDQATGLEALARMGEPEPTSRSQDHEGRRIIRIDGGFLLLNYVKYRDKDHTTAERSARYRDRKRHGVIPSRHGVTGRGVTHADADADADENAIQEGAKSLSSPAPPAPDAIAVVRSVFDEWQRVHSHPTAKLDAKRTARIRGALKLRGPDELKQAIRGALTDDWLMGRDAKSPRKYDGLETILRDAAQIERLIDLENGKGTPGYRPLAAGASRQTDQGVDPWAFHDKERK